MALNPEYSFVLWTVSASDDQKYTCTRGRSHGTHSISKQEKVESAAEMLNECLEPNSLEARTGITQQSNPIQATSRLFQNPQAPRHFPMKEEKLLRPQLN